jgi:amino acid adenylation domain-containing protein
MIIRRFEQQVRERPDNSAIITGTGSLTYEELDRQSHRVAGGLKRCRPGGGDGDSLKIALLMDDAGDMISAMLGVLRTGGVYVPLVSDYPGERIRYILHHADTGIVVTDRRNFRAVSEAAATIDREIPVLDIQDLKNGDAVVETFAAGNDAYILYTSGSTGVPKGVRQTQQSIIHFIDRYAENLGLTHRDRLTLFSSFSHDASVMDVYAALLTGAALYPLNLKTEGIFAGLYQWLKDKKITVWHSVPTVYRYFMAQMNGNRESLDLPDLRYVVFGGEAVLHSDIRRFISRFPGGCRLYNLYGQTESTYNSGQFYDAGGNGGSGDEEITVTLGEPVTGTELVVVDEDGEEVDALEVGEIVVLSPHVSPGYWKDDEGTEQKFWEEENDGEIERGYFTGDRGRRLLDGTVQFMGRTDNQVKIRGFRVEPAEIENAISLHDDVTAAAVKIIENSEQEKMIAAYFSARRNIDLQELRRFLENRLVDYMVPPFLKQLLKLPVTVSGKIDRLALPAPDITSGIEYAPPSDHLEKQLVKTWSTILNLGENVIGIDSNFFQLGGHSLNATQLTARIYREMQVKVPLAEVFKRPTIRTLAEFIRQTETTTSVDIPPVEKKEYYPLSAAQKSMLFLQLLDPESPTYNLPFLLDMGTDADRQKLEDTFGELIRRHEILRTGFEIIGGEPVQRVYDYDDIEFEMIYREVEPREADDVMKGFVIPFNPAEPPLLRAGLIKARDRYTLLADIHHIIVDNTSFMFLENDYLALYDGRTLSPLELQYKDYSAWQNSADGRKEIAEQGRYWHRMFDGGLPVLELPYDNSRPSIQRFKGKCIGRVLGDEDTAGIKRLAEQHNATLFMVMLAVFKVLLHRMSGSGDIVVGTPLASRRHPAFQEMAGMFVNTLPVRSTFSGNDSFVDLLERIRETTVGMYENQEYPFEELVEHLDIRRDGSRNPVFDVMFNLLDERLYKGDASKMGERERLAEMQETARMDLILTVIDRGPNLYLRFEFASDLFKPDTMERLVDYYRRILTAASTNPGGYLVDIPLLTDEEMKCVLQWAVGPENDIEPGLPLHRLFEMQVRKTPDHAVVVLPPERLTYRVLNEQADGLARHLAGRGIGPGSIIALQVKPSLEMAIGILGIMKAGGAYLPVDPGYPQDRIRYMTADSNAAMILTEKDITGIMQNSPLQPVTGAAREPVPVQPADPAYIIYTSGTTGKPKGVVVEHRSAVNTLLYRKEAYGMGPGCISLQLFSYAFDGFVTSFFTPVISGAQVVLLSGKIMEPDLVKRLILNHRVTHFISVPSLYRELLETMSAADMASLDVVTLAGEPLSPDLLEKTGEKNPFLEIAHEYGITEAAVMSTLKRNQQQEKRISIGKPAAGTYVFIMDRWNNIQPPGVPGEMVIAGTGLARGYLNNPQLTAEKFIELQGDPGIGRKNRIESFASSVSSVSSVFSLPAAAKLYKTGDRARYFPDGDIQFLGRSDQQVKIRGYRIEPAEIETRLLAHEQINESVVLPEKNNRGMYELWAYLVPGPGGKEDLPTAAQLKTFLARNLPLYMLPSYFVPVDSIPLGPNGKVDRNALSASRDKRKLSRDSDTAYAPPVNDAQHTIAGIWKELVEHDSPGIDDNFFDAGGNSLKAVQLIHLINKKLNSDLTVMAVFENPTIRALADKISNNTNNTNIVPKEPKTLEKTDVVKKVKKIQQMRKSRPKPGK